MAPNDMPSKINIHLKLLLLLLEIIEYKSWTLNFEELKSIRSLPLDLKDDGHYGYVYKWKKVIENRLLSCPSLVDCVHVASRIYQVENQQQIDDQLQI